MKLIRVGVDLAKNVFQVHGVDRNEKAMWRRKLTRENWLKVLLETVEPGCEVGMESCGGAHHWARKLQAGVQGEDYCPAVCKAVCEE
jgi:transposase